MFTLRRPRAGSGPAKDGDRATPEEWEIGGAKTILDRARDYVRNILETHFPDHISPQLNARIRDRLDIRLPRERMRPGPRCK